MERYKNLIETYPQILQRLSVKNLTSFLGMTSETLSRIKNKIHTSLIYNQIKQLKI